MSPERILGVNHLFKLLTLLTSADRILPAFLNKPLFGAGADESICPSDPALSLGAKFGSVIVLGEMEGLETGLVEEASLDTARVVLGRIEALVLGRRISRRSGNGT